MTKLTTLAVMLSLLAACSSGGIGMPGSPAWHATASQEDKLHYYTNACMAYGFEPGTPQMAQCVAEESRNSRQNASNRMAALNTQSALRQPVTCIRSGNITTCR